MNIDNVCMLIPTHPPRYSFLYNLIHKLQKNSIHIDLFLVFSSHDDYNAFAVKEYIKPIIIVEPITTRCIVTFKKFYGLKQLIENTYDYIICCDSEIDIIPEYFTKDNITSRIKQIFCNKKIYAGFSEHPLTLGIIKSCTELFPNNMEKLKNITMDYTLYFWFSDLPVYRRTDLSTFFFTINYENITWNHFDYIIYQLFLILNDGFEIINITPITNMKWSLEQLYTNDKDVLQQLVDIGYGFSWNVRLFYIKNPDFVHQQKGFILYHLDR